MNTSRLRVLFGLMIALATIVWFRIFYWQIIKSDALKKQSVSQRTFIDEINSQRGEIQFSDGFPMASHAFFYRVYAQKKFFEEHNDKWIETKKILSTADWPKSNFDWVPIYNNASESARSQLLTLAPNRFNFEPLQTRIYPEGSVSAHLLGFVGLDNQGKKQGYFGLEGYYNGELVGRTGQIIGERDGSGRTIVIGEEDIINARNGKNILTTIDRVMQKIVYENLNEALVKYGAKSGSVVGMDPNNGNILFWASLPAYDNQDYANYDPTLYRDPIISEAYEPGSTFKVITMASALDYKNIKITDTCPICHGPLQIGEYLIKTWNDKYYPKSNPTEILQHSDNVGMVFISRSMPKNVFLEYIKRFGFGAKTGIDLEGESPSSLRPEKDWYEIDYATASFGQGIAVTPLQMVRAVSALANGGYLIDPRVVKSLDGRETVSKNRKKIIGSESASQITEMMINNVENGESKWAKPKNLKVAGKTGTAQISILGKYDDRKTIASFIGFAPADKPKFVMLTILREPTSSQWGSETAAPLWFKIATEIDRYLYNKKV
jgi:cell division protein FtsI/penicillin-binding protein 2